MTETLTSNRMG